MVTRTRSADVRSRLEHPVIDGDGHISELGPVLLDFMNEVGGSHFGKRYAEAIGVEGLYARQMMMSLDERRDEWLTYKNWWGAPTANTLDRATTMIPGLLYRRLDEMGIDFTILYPGHGFFPARMEDEELRRVGCRGVNTFLAETCREFADRMTPAAVIPMHTPQEAVDAIEHAVQVLGFKVVVLQSFVRRPVPRILRQHPEIASLADRLDFFGLDSDYDYDPVWAKCQQLRVAPTFHSDSQGWGSHRSPSNYVHNHIGTLATCHHALAKALFLGGVSRRFPHLNFAFLEGGVAWACSLYADLLAHWEKRNVKALERLDPANLDRPRLMSLLAEYGDTRTQSLRSEIEVFLGREPGRPAVLDEFAGCAIEGPEDIRDLFVRPFYFGCEADDPMTAQAFRTAMNPLGARLQAMFGSDIGHWDVPDMAEVLGEAFELVERGTESDEDFRDLVFANPARLHAGVNPDFFKGTRVETAVEGLLKTGV